MMKGKHGVNKQNKPRKNFLYSGLSYRLFLVGLIIFLLFLITAALCVGRYVIDVGVCLKILLSPILRESQNWTVMEENVVMILRLPRILGSVLVGAGLALSGATYQSMFKNPMVSPDILGVSNGASIGACTAILLGLGPFFIESWAFVGGILAVTITTAIPRLLKNDSSMMLVLSGIITGSLMNSILGLIRYLAISSGDDTILADMTYWMMGSFAKISMKDLKTAAPIIGCCCLILLLLRFQLNLLSLGEQEARTLGVHVSSLQLIVITCATLITASCVSISGTVGWVGLVVPHLARMIVGVDNKRMLPVAMLLGSIFMLVVDTLCRSISSAELPISIITGIIGAPFYFFLLYKQRMKM